MNGDDAGYNLANDLITDGLKSLAEMRKNNTGVCPQHAEMLTHFERKYGIDRFMINSIKEIKTAVYTSRLQAGNAAALSAQFATTTAKSNIKDFTDASSERVLTEFRLGRLLDVKNITVFGTILLLTTIIIGAVVLKKYGVF